MSGKLDIDIRMFLYKALGASEYLHKTIEFQYRQNEIEYYEAYKNSNYYKCPLFSRYNTKKMEAMEKLAGIDQFELKDDLKKDSFIMKLIKKGFKNPYVFVKERKQIDLGEVVDTVLNKKGKIEDIEESEIFHAGIVALFLCIKFEKPYYAVNPSGEFVLRGLKEAMIATARGIVGYSDEEAVQYEDELKGFYERFRVNRKQKEINLSKMLDCIVMADEKQLLDRNPSRNYFDDIRGEVFRNGVSKYIGAVSGWLKLLGFDESDITSLNVTQDEIRNVFLQTIGMNRENGLKSQEEQDLYVVACFMLMALTKEYRATQSYYFDDVKTRLYDEIIEQRQKLEMKYKVLQEKEGVLIQENTSLRENNKELRKSLKDVEGQRDGFGKQLSQIESNRKELIALREYMFAQENEVPIEEDEDIESLTSSIKAIKGAIVGGHVNWQKKLKEHLPNFTFVSPDNKNIDFSFTDNLDVVFVNTTYNNHALYYKLMSRMNNNDTPLRYLPNRTNIKAILRDVNASMQKLLIK